jgi:PKD repeat protein
MQNMKNHGILYPTFNDYAWLGARDQAIQIRQAVGLPRDKLLITSTSSGGNTTPSYLTDTLTPTMQNWRNFTTAYGITDMYIYGVDEALGAALVNEGPAWAVTHAQGGKIFVATHDDAFALVGNTLDLPIMSEFTANPEAYSPYHRSAYPNTTKVTQWHSIGKPVWPYGIPQGGVEDPGIFRKNYGFILWRYGYDGALTWAYDGRYGNYWDDWDDYPGGVHYYRDHTMIYPSTDKEINTIEYEGFREATYDSRYADTLAEVSGNTSEAISIIDTGLAQGDSMSKIRETIIQHILGYSPTASFNKNVTTGPAPLVVDLIDTSTGTNLTYLWIIGESISTSQHPIVTLTLPGTYSINLTVTNPVGSNTSATQNITVGNGPIASFTEDITAGEAPLTVTFTSTSTGTGLTYLWNFGDGDTTNNTEANPIHTYNSGGTFFVSGEKFSTSLTVTNAFGTSTSESHTISVGSSTSENASIVMLVGVLLLIVVILILAIIGALEPIMGPAMGILGTIMKKEK